MKETKKIYSRKMALYLAQNGCRVLDTELNFYNPKYYVYLFEDNEKLQAKMSDYMEIYRSERDKQR